MEIFFSIENAFGFFKSFLKELYTNIQVKIQPNPLVTAWAPNTIHYAVHTYFLLKPLSPHIYQAGTKWCFQWNSCEIPWKIKMVLDFLLKQELASF